MTALRPWREVAVPHSDVLKGTFQQAEFAADITAVRTGKAPDIYQDATAFFDRTFITNGMRDLLTQVAQRLAGRGGDPVIQLQTAFGGGKTHSMLAVWHLATRTCPLTEMPGVASLVEAAGLSDVPRAEVAVIDGTAHSPGQPWKSGRTQIKTLWGELAWQLGRADSFAMVAEADASGTSPGKETLRALLEKHAPCVVLFDELVAYVSQFEEGQALSGGTFESNLAFVQALTEAVKQVPTAIVLASLPESELEVGSPRGKTALDALAARFARVQSIWKPVAIEEAFEIVRRRLFEPIANDAARAAVCRAFADTYRAEAAAVPGETQEGRYLDRLLQAYPIHPELFDRLYEDWSTIDGFQRTRGVLKLMAKVINRLWKTNNSDLMLMPGSLPLAEADVRNDLLALLPQGWDAVLDRDIDGERAETTELEGREARFGQVQAARRVARTLFLGSAPSSVSITHTARGLDRARVLLGCLQPGQPPPLYADALARLADRLHYLNTSGDREGASARYWFDTRANLRREMEDRKRRFDAGEVNQRIEAVTRRLFANSTTFNAVHTFTPHADVPDDPQLRLVVLGPQHAYLKEDRQACDAAVVEYLRQHGTQPRHRANRLVFIVADHASLGRLGEAVRAALAWESIVEDVEAGRLNVDQERRRQAEREAKTAGEVLPRAARECFKWLLCPVQDEPTDPTCTLEAHRLGTASGTPGSEVDRICDENELVITAWSPVHLREELKRLYWKAEKPHVRAFDFWEDSLRYLYLPRLATRDVLAGAIREGSKTAEFFGTAYGMAGEAYEGFQFGRGGVSLDDTLLLIEPDRAREVAAEQAAAAAARGEADPGHPLGGVLPAAGGPAIVGGGPPAGSPAAPKPKAFHGSVVVTASVAKSQLVTLADEIITLLASDPTADVRVTLEIAADFPEGASDQIKRAISENATALSFNTAVWE